MTEENFESVLENLPAELKDKLSELEDKLDQNSYESHYPNFRSRFINVDGIAPHIVKKAGIAKLKEVYRDLINLFSSHLEFVPKHEKTVVEEKIEDFHHHFPGNGGYEEVVKIIPAYYKISYEGHSQINKYLTKLRKTYCNGKKPALFPKILQPFRRFFGP